MTSELFEFEERAQYRVWREALCDGAVVLRGFALPDEAAISAALYGVINKAPFRHMVTPGGFRMSVAMTNCGSCGWVTDRTGYRYDAIDPESSNPWPCMPALFMKLAQNAAAKAGFKDFEPDACLVNRYEPGARLSLHQDKDEQDFSAPIVSVSLGIPAVFLWGGLRRADKPVRVQLVHGDVMVWGGPSRLRYHGVLPLKEGNHPLMGNSRINLTFRKAAS
jgi:DNA oxidative demethylase